MAEKQITEARVKGLIAAALNEFKAGLVELLQPEFDKLVTKEEAASDLQKNFDDRNNFVSVQTFSGCLSNLITKDQWNEALEGVLNTAVPLSGLLPALSVDSQFDNPTVEKIPPEYLTGLVFKSAKPKKPDDGIINVPTDRPLTQKDVLSWKDNGDTVTLSTSDGKKYTVDKE